jgi:predicted dehydrogenase
MLADMDIDVIYISLPNSLHAEWTIKAAKAGKHVLCEKPIALSIEEIDAIKSASNDANVVIAEAFMYRHHPQSRLVKQLVEDGKIGDLQLILGSFSFYLDRSRKDDIRLDPEMGGGSIWDIGCYPISYARFIAGATPEQVFGWQVSSERGVDLTFVGQLRFPDGVMAQIDSSFLAPLRMHVEIVGSKGVLYVPNPYKPDHNETVILQRKHKMEEISAPDAPLYLGEVEDMADAILESKPNLISLDDSRTNVNTIVSLLKSAKEGKPIQC